MARALYGGGMHDARRGRRVRDGNFGNAARHGRRCWKRSRRTQLLPCANALVSTRSTALIPTTTTTLSATCQCRENVQGGRVCGGRIKSRGSTKSLWNHVQKKHPCTFAKLNNQGDIAHTSLAEVLATPAELSVSISYQQMVDPSSRAPVQTLSAAIEALQQARELREA